jgi:hypothetical protein
MMVQERRPECKILHKIAHFLHTACSKHQLRCSLPGTGEETCQKFEINEDLENDLQTVRMAYKRVFLIADIAMEFALNGCLIPLTFETLPWHQCTCLSLDKR